MATDSTKKYVLDAEGGLGYNIDKENQKITFFVNYGDMLNDPHFTDRIAEMLSKSIVYGVENPNDRTDLPDEAILYVQIDQ